MYLIRFSSLASRNQQCKAVTAVATPQAHPFIITIIIIIIIINVIIIITIITLFYFGKIIATK